MWKLALQQINYFFLLNKNDWPLFGPFCPEYSAIDVDLLITHTLHFSFALITTHEFARLFRFIKFSPKLSEINVMLGVNSFGVKQWFVTLFWVASLLVWIGLYLMFLFLNVLFDWPGCPSVTVCICICLCIKCALCLSAAPCPLVSPTGWASWLSRYCDPDGEHRGASRGLPGRL